ncbi:bifunctional diaminohydroxyphosphoribosylaminopyrimidine deaminase/5-amino-6-(5-phosphoribosylamino)uracil reductase RibD [Clostridium sp. LBM24168]
MKNKEYYEKYMMIALKLALKGKGFVNPNPLVGAVIVKNEKILGKGYHKLFGGPHAEIYALKEAGEQARGADLYVTLEPCSHYGKTPPCAEAIIKSGIKKVIIGSLDPNPLVSGKGIEMLRDSNIEVITGVMEDEVVKMNEIFINYITRKIPFVIMKSAVTLDGKIATVSGQSKWITGEESREKVHQIRNRVMAIMVGIGTIIEDDPLLTTRLKDKSKDAKVVILDSRLSIPLKSRIFSTINDREIIIACTNDFNRENYSSLTEKGVYLIICPKNSENKVDLNFLVRKLGERGIDSILLEGGGNVNFSALRYGIVDKVIYFIAPKIFGGKDAKTSVEGSGIKNISDEIKLKDISVKKVGKDVMLEAYVDKKR